MMTDTDSGMYSSSCSYVVSDASFLKNPWNNAPMANWCEHSTFYSMYTNMGDLQQEDIPYTHPYGDAPVRRIRTCCPG